jgi:hypothetical protein
VCIELLIDLAGTEFLGMQITDCIEKVDKLTVQSRLYRES